MQIRAEVTGAFESPEDCNALLYAPLDAAVHGTLHYRRSRVYDLEISGGETAAAAAEEFVRKVLVDPVSQVLHLGQTPALDDALFHLDYGMKPGALDLEKEAVLRYFAELEEPGFSLDTFIITQRIYVFGDAGATVPSSQFVRDIVNPAIHTWNVSDGRDCA